MLKDQIGHCRYSRKLMLRIFENAEWKLSILQASTYIKAHEIEHQVPACRYRYIHIRI